jgi:hypothetical protein
VGSAAAAAAACGASFMETSCWLNSVERLIFCGLCIVLRFFGVQDRRGGLSFFLKECFWTKTDLKESVGERCRRLYERVCKSFWFDIE